MKEAQNENRNRKRFLLQLTFAAKHRKFASQTANCKGPKKKDAEKEISLVATSDKGYAPLDLRRLAGGGLSLGAVRTQRKQKFFARPARTRRSLLKKLRKTFLALVLCEHSAFKRDKFNSLIDKRRGRVI